MNHDDASQTLNTLLLNVQDPNTLRARWMEHICAAFEATHAVCHNIGFDPEDGQLKLCDVQCFGPADYVERAMGLNGTPAHDLGVDAGNAAALNSATLYRVADLPEALYELVWRPFGLASCISYNAVEDGRFCGHISVYRTVEADAQFTEDALTGPARAWERATVRLLAITRAMELDRAFGHRGAIVCTPDGAPWMVADAAHTQPALPPHVVEAIRAFAAGEAQRHDLFVRRQRVSLTRLHSASGDRAVLVMIHPMLPYQVKDILRLTPTQRRICAYLANGATTTEVAAAMCRSAETIRSHIKAIYARLGIGSRAELTALFNSAFTQ